MARSLTALAGAVGLLAIGIATVTATIPVINTRTPAANAVNAHPRSAAVMDFNVAVTPREARLITLRRFDTNALVSQVAAVSSFVTASSGNTRITVNFPIAEALVGRYYIEVEAGAFVDSVGDAFLGIADKSWAFSVTGPFVAGLKALPRFPFALSGKIDELLRSN